MDVLDSDIKYLPSVGPRRAELFGKELGIFTFRDLIYFFPFRYVDRSRFYAISEIDSATAYIQLRGVIRDMRIVGAQRGRRLVAVLSDDTGSIDLVFFQGIKWVSERIKPGKEYIVFGKPSSFNGEINMVHPEIDEVSAARPGTGAMMGVYPSTEHLRHLHQRQYA